MPIISRIVWTPLKYDDYVTLMFTFRSRQYNKVEIKNMKLSSLFTKRIPVPIPGWSIQFKVVGYQI